MSTFCPACESSLEEGAVLCVECGYHLEKGTRLETVTRETVEPEAQPDFRDGFLQPVSHWFFQWMKYGALVLSPFLIGPVFLLGFAEFDAIFLFILLLKGLRDLFLLSLLIGMVGAGIKALSLLTSDSPLIFWSIAAIVGLTVAIFMMAVGWEWFWNWAMQSAERQPGV
ncbi:MAG: hypothetical protein AAF456_13370 [Planctomycetota bacterium]